MSLRNKRTLRADLQSRPALIGSFIAIAHPAAVEIVGSAGFDFVTIDAEHSQIDRAGIENLVRAADAVGIPAMVRVPCTDSDWISSVLDAGASGVLVPRVSTAVQAKAAVTAMRYPPEGDRGVGPGRASLYGARLGQYLESANESLLLAIQIETQEGVANAADIAAVPGVDLVFVGPGDLSVSLAAKGEGGKAKLDAAIDSVIDACLKRGRAVGIFTTDPDRVGDWLARGLKLIILASDSVFLQAGAAAAAALAGRAGGSK